VISCSQARIIVKHQPEVNVKYAFRTARHLACDYAGMKKLLKKDQESDR
jgi:hypothetical protein